MPDAKKTTPPMEKKAQNEEKSAPAAKLYRADRSFNDLKVGDQVELADDHPYLKTGYMIEVGGEQEAAQQEADQAAADALAASGEQRAEGLAGGTSDEGAAGASDLAGPGSRG